MMSVPSRMRGIGGGAIVNAPPAAPSNGSGGPGILGIKPAMSSLSDLTTGRVTLGLVNIAIVGMVGFYFWTRSAQGGG